MAEILPFGGHDSVTSLLAETMNDPKIVSVVIFAFDEEGNMKPCWFDATNTDMALIGAFALKKATE